MEVCGRGGGRVGRPGKNSGRGKNISSSKTSQSNPELAPGNTKLNASGQGKRVTSSGESIPKHVDVISQPKPKKFKKLSQRRRAVQSSNWEYYELNWTEIIIPEADEGLCSDPHYIPDF